MREAKLSGTAWLDKRVFRERGHVSPLLLFPNLVIQSSREQPSHTEHVHRGADGAIAQTVFSLTKTPPAMVHRNFHQPVPSVFDQRGDKAMHSLERKQHGYAFAPHRLECATGIAYAVFCVTAPDCIGDSAGEPLCKRIPAVRAITANQISAA